MLGVTSPLSLASSSEKDILLADELVKVLKEQKAFEPPEKALLRRTVLSNLDKITKRFVHDVCRKQGVSEVEVVNAKVLTYGSYRLGVHAEDADIDTLCVLPRNITRDDFFDTMQSILKKQPGIEKLNAIRESFVPVMKFKYFNIPIDLVCTILPLSTIPEDLNVNNPSLLRYMDDRCIRSLNGTRVADELLDLVPNVHTFRTVLRCIKLWATKRAIYSNVVGFLGGVAWAILVARICQLYPNACASTVVSKFFRIVAQWNWPSPVILKAIEEYSGNGDIHPWNPRINVKDREHKMPIITPSYPSMCATHNVTASSMKIIAGELNLAAGIVDRVMIGTASWNDLFKENIFFQRYEHYIQMIVSADDHESLLEGAGFIESRLRQLLLRLESSPQISLAHPFIEGIEASKRCTQMRQVYDFIGAKPPMNQSISTTPIDQTFYTKTFYIGLYFRFDVKTPSTLNLSSPIKLFKKQILQNEGFDQQHLQLHIRYLDRSSLPQQLVSAGSATMKRAYQEIDIPNINTASVNLNNNDRNGKNRNDSNHPYTPSSLPDVSNALSVPPI
ncbi:Poly(A) polymerase [Chlamydoabsidia padenii]|nr:Poly(A) polymerase [Chlamydoabsidia padenii]